jgi:hypothetical protein
LTRAISVPFWGAPDGAIPVDRARTGSKHHLLVDASGIRWRSALPAGTATTLPNCCHWSKTSTGGQSLGRSDGHARSLTDSSPTAAMTTTSTADYYALLGSHPSSPAEEQPTVLASGASAGSWSAASPTYTTSAGSEHATKRDPEIHLALPHTRLLNHLLATPTLILKGLLRATTPIRRPKARDLPVSRVSPAARRLQNSRK